MYNKLLKNLAMILFCLIAIITFCNKSVIAYGIDITEPKITYRAHVQDYGWDKDYKLSNGIAGTTGKAKQMEALEINLENTQGVIIQYRAHVEDYGWMDWTMVDNQNNTKFVGTTGKAKQMEAVQIVVKGLEGYKLQYRVHVSNIGWMNWITAEDNTNSTSFAGTTGRALQIEAFEIRLVPIEKDEQGDFTYRAHVQDQGWKTFKNVGGEEEEKQQTPTSNSFVGTIGKSKQMEALEINYNAPSGVELKYRAHVQDYGWMSWVTADNIKGTNFVGTTGKAKQIEAIQIVVEGLEDYDIKYRAHVQDYGWLDWVTAGKSINTATTQKGTYAGTTGEAKRIEALEIVVIKTEENQQVEHQHKYSQWETIKAPTCTTTGLEKRVCDECNHVETRIMQAFHSLKESMIRLEEKDVKATCTTKGQQYYTCKYCGDYFFNYTSELGHQFSEEYTVDKQATCTENGTKSIHCTREGCMEKINEETIAATGHNWIKTHQNVTCTLDEMNIETCQNCGEVKTEVLERAKGHSFEEYIYNNDATCTKDGTETAHCLNCNEEDVRIKVGSKKEHELVQNNDGKDATCTENGLTPSKRCLHCDYVEPQTIIPAGHKWEEVYKESTCTGCTLSYVCKVCRETTPEQKVKMGTGHKWNHDETECENCGMKAPINEFSVYFVNYFVNPNEAEPFENGKYEFYESRRRDDEMNKGQGSTIKVKAPQAKPGYRFKAWINAITGEEFTQETTIVNTWKDMDKYFKPVYEKVVE